MFYILVYEWIECVLWLKIMDYLRNWIIVIIFYLVIFNKYVYCLMYSSFGIKIFLGIFGV